MAEEQAAAAQGDQAQQSFALQRIYTKDVSFESPGTPNVFRKQWQPAINVDLNTRSEAIDDEGNFEVVLTITVTAKVDDETAFLCEVQQAGIFLVTGVDRIMNMNWEDILPPPKGAGKDVYLTAVTRIDDKLVEIIDVEKILAEVSPLGEDVTEAVLSKSADRVPGHLPVLVVDDS